MKRTTQHIDYSDDAVRIARYAKALSHPVRLTILKLLSNQSCCFTTDLVDVLPLAQSTISQHLKELKDSGLIQGEINPPKIKYCINQEKWEEAKALFEVLFSKDFTEIKIT
ncbi:ArsR/SmtB family transcription factor [Lutibacter sp.]